MRASLRRPLGGGAALGKLHVARRVERVPPRPRACSPAPVPCALAVGPRVVTASATPVVALTCRARACPARPFPSPSSPSRRRSTVAVVAAPPCRAPGLGTGLSGQEAGWLGQVPGLGSVWAGHEADSLWHRPGQASGLGCPGGRPPQTPVRPVARPGPTCGPAQTVKTVFV